MCCNEGDNRGSIVFLQILCLRQDFILHVICGGRFNRSIAMTTRHASPFSAYHVPKLNERRTCGSDITRLGLDSLGAFSGCQHE